MREKIKCEEETNKMQRKIFLILCAVLIAVSSFLVTDWSDNVEANSTLQNRIKTIQEERADNQAETEQKSEEIPRIENEMKALNAEIREIDQKTMETNQKIRNKASDIELTKERIEELLEEIRILEQRIAERDELLKNRVRSMYKNGGSVNYIEVVLGSRSFGDLVNRLQALSTIAQQDRNIIEAHHNDKMQVEYSKELMEEELIVLEDQLIELESLQAVLVQQRKEKDAVMGQLERQEGQLHAELMDLEEVDEILAAQEKAMQAELKAWEERQRRLEEERKRQEELARQSGQTYSTPPVTTEGNFMRPATGRISSPYGPRWGSFHHGIDIGKGGRTEDVPIVAAETGTVIRSYYSNSYGNTVMISHNVDGRVITTLYAHMENRFVVDGQRVEKGQILGYMGNTGHSFGPHLHFEVHEGPWNFAKSNSVNPMKYIPN